MTDVSLVPEESLKKYATLLDRAKELEISKKSQEDFMSFVKVAWPEFINGRHHKIMAEKLSITCLVDGQKSKAQNNADDSHSRTGI